MDFCRVDIPTWRYFARITILASSRVYIGDVHSVSFSFSFSSLVSFLGVAGCRGFRRVIIFSEKL